MPKCQGPSSSFGGHLNGINKKVNKMIDQDEELS